MTMTRFIMTRDINGYNGFGVPFSDIKYSTTLVANTEQNFTIPSTGEATYPNVLAVFSSVPGSTIWVALNDTAVLPGVSFTQTTSELNPAARYVHPGDVLSFITGDAATEIGVELYAVA